MIVNANSGRIPLKPPVRLALLVLMFATGALLLLLSGPGAQGAHVNPAVVATVSVGSGPVYVGVNATTNRVYVANFGSNNVSVIDGAANAVVATVPVGGAPVGVGVNATTDRVYVANAGNVSVIDGAANAVVATVSVGSGPFGVGVNAATDRVYVANDSSNNVSVIDGATNAVVATVPVGGEPLGVGVNATTDRVYVANGVSNNVSVIDGATNAVVATVPVGTNPQGVGVNATTDRVYVANIVSNNVSVIDGATNAVVATVPVGTNPQGVGVNAATDRVYVANINSDNVSVIDGAADAVVATVPVGGLPQGVGVNATTDRVYVVNESSNNVSVIGDGPIPPDSASDTVSSSGGTVSTGTTATAADPIETSVTVPAGTSGGTVSISEQPITTASPGGFSFFGQEVVITAPAATADNPLVLVFHLDASLIADCSTLSATPCNENTIDIFKDGVQVLNCTATAPIYPNPCVSDRTTLTGPTNDDVGDVQITVLTSTASNWNFGVAAPVPHDAAMSKLDTGSKDIHLGATGINFRDVKAHCLNKTAGGDTIRCTVQLSGLPAGCTAQSSGHDKMFGTADDGPVIASPGGFLLNNTSSYTLNQDRNFDFKVRVACTPPITSPTFPAIVTFEGCADGGNIDRNNPCSDNDDTHPADNVRVRFNRLLK